MVETHLGGLKGVGCGVPGDEHIAQRGADKRVV